MRLRTFIILHSSLCILLPGCAGPTTPPPDPDRVEPLAPRQVTPSLRDAARDELVKFLTATDEVLRTNAIEGVRETMGSGGRDAFLHALKDPSPMVRFAACMAVGEVRLAEARPLLYPLLNDKNAHVHIGAAYALHRLGDTRHSAALEYAIASGDPKVRGNACVALGRLGEKSAVKLLQNLLRDGRPEIRVQAAEAMWRLGDERALETLVALALQNKRPDLQAVAYLALAAPRNPIVIEHVRAGLLPDNAMGVRLVTARAMGMIGSDEGYALAVEGARSNDARERALAALALGAIARPDAQDHLAGLLKDKDPATRVAAATAILQLR